VTFALGGCLWVAEIVAVMHGGALARGIVAVIFALLTFCLFWICRASFRRLLARPLPRRGPGRWLTTQPVSMMVLGYLAYVLALMLAVGVFYSITHMPAAPFFFGAGPICLLGALPQIAAWLELRRRQDTHPH
jgi:hypothetical protein